MDKHLEDLTPLDVLEYVKELEARNAELVSKIEVLEFHLNEIATSDLVASNLRCMAKHALNNKNG